ncbi:MAG: secretin N-terminal domain-containing protein [Myxococcota bacterium]
MTSRSAALVLLLLALAGDVYGQGARFRIYEPRSRTADELAPLVAPLLGPSGAAVADPNGGSLILEGDPEAIGNALAALETLDAPPHQYRIESETRTRAAQDGAFAQAGWVDRGGFRVARIAAGAGSGTRAHGVAASVVVLEGRTAEVWTGTSVPVHLGSELALVPVQSGFRVRPRSLGSGEIELEITPVLAERGRGGEIRETGAATQIRVKPGEALAIAGVDEQRDSRGASFPPGAHADSAASDSTLVVRVTPLESSPASPGR